MSIKRIVLLLSIFIASCFIVTNWNNIGNEVMRWQLSRSLPESRQEFSDAIQQIPFEEDELISNEFSELRILNNPPNCIAGRSQQIFASTSDYETTLSRFVAKFENIGWNLSRPVFPLDDVISYISVNEHMLVSILPLARFGQFRIDYPDSLSAQDNVYAIVITYHNPDAEICTFG